MKKFLRPFLPLLALSLASCGNFDDKPEQTEERDFETKQEETRKILMNNNFNVCIIGKPNVGKSTIFNKILGSDISQVSEISGTTIYPISYDEKFND
ncbi:MAG: GTPase, partial [Bdellovibrionales bacterium]